MFESVAVAVSENSEFFPFFLVTNELEFGVEGFDAAEVMVVGGDVDNGAVREGVVSLISLVEALVIVETLVTSVEEIVGVVGNSLAESLVTWIKSLVALVEPLISSGIEPEPFTQVLSKAGIKIISLSTIKPLIISTLISLLHFPVILPTRIISPNNRIPFTT